MNKKVVSTIAILIVIGTITITTVQLRADSADVSEVYLPLVRSPFEPKLTAISTSTTMKPLATTITL